MVDNFANRSVRVAELKEHHKAQAEPGMLCTPAALTLAESTALTTLQANSRPGADPDATKSSVDQPVQAAFAGPPTAYVAAPAEERMHCGFREVCQPDVNSRAGSRVRACERASAKRRE